MLTFPPNALLTSSSSKILGSEHGIQILVEREVLVEVPDRPLLNLERERGREMGVMVKSYAYASLQVEKSMRVFGTVRVLVMLVIGATELAGQCLVPPAQRLIPGDGADIDQFGDTVAIHGRIAAINSPQHAVQGVPTGVVYVYRQGAGLWNFEQQLVGSGTQGQDAFGQALAVSGNVVLASSLEDDLGLFSGSAYAFRHNGTQWQEEHKFLASDGVGFDSFGASVALDGNVVVIGATGCDDLGDGAGAAYVFRHDGSRWQEEAKLLASDAMPNDAFGREVAVSGNTLVVAAVTDDLGAASGAVYVFRFDGTRWNEEQKLLAADGAAGDQFGTSVSLDGSTLAIGASLDDDLGQSSGSAYIFRYAGNRWQQEQKLIAADGATGDGYGVSVAVDQGRVAVGAYLADVATANSGAAYIYRFAGTTWIPTAKLSAPLLSVGSWHGYSVGMHQGTVITGAPFESSLGWWRGAAFTYDVTDLSLTASATLVQAGDDLAFNTCGGFPNGPVLLSVVGVNGAPVWWRVILDRFDSQGEWTVRGRVPPTLVGLSLDFIAVGLLQPGQAGSSNVIGVRVR